jgi:hypothetical protein
VTYLRAGLMDTGDWQVEASEDGIHATVIASNLPTAKHARAFIDAREGRLTPLRHDSDDSPLPGHGRADSTLSAATP